MSRVAATAYSASIAAAATGTPQRGSVHSVFAAAANIVFPALTRQPEMRATVTERAIEAGQPLSGRLSEVVAPGRPQGSPLLSEFVLSLNALDGPRMPNGLQLSAPAGAFPFAALRPGMSVLFGAQRLHIEAIECSFDLSTCTRWNPHIHHPNILDRQVLRENRERLAKQPGVAIRNFNEISWQRREIPSLPAYFVKIPDRDITFPDPRDRDGMYTFACSLCGRGVGLTPAGDDILVGWMVMGWLLYGPDPDFLEACQQIVEVARRQTHLLSQCWLACAAEGDAALPIVSLLEALAQPRAGEGDAELEQAAQVVLATGETSGADVITGILLGLETFLTDCGAAG